MSLNSRLCCIKLFGLQYCKAKRLPKTKQCSIARRWKVSSSHGMYTHERGQRTHPSLANTNGQSGRVASATTKVCRSPASTFVSCGAGGGTWKNATQQGHQLLQPAWLAHHHSARWFVQPPAPRLLGHPNGEQAMCIEDLTFWPGRCSSGCNWTSSALPSFAIAAIASGFRCAGPTVPGAR